MMLRAFATSNIKSNQIIRKPPPRDLSRLMAVLSRANCNARFEKFTSQTESITPYRPQNPYHCLGAGYTRYIVFCSCTTSSQFLSSNVYGRGIDGITSG